MENEQMYPYTAKEARERGELEQWRANYRANCACAGAIELVIRESFDGMHLKEDCAKRVIDHYGYMTGTLRAQEHGHQPLVFENHGIDARYHQVDDVAPTMSARYGTGGNNVPLVEEPIYCITGNAIDRKPENGGNGIGYQENVMYTLNTMDRHAVCYSTDDLYTCEPAGDKDLPFLLIRRLTPLECERLQGFPDGWTDIPGASDSARYKALGNSVAIPCVDFVMKCMVDTIRESEGME